MKCYLCDGPDEASGSPPMCLACCRAHLPELMPAPPEPTEFVTLAHIDEWAERCAELCVKLSKQRGPFLSGMQFVKHKPGDPEPAFVDRSVDCPGTEAWKAREADAGTTAATAVPVQGRGKAAPGKATIPPG